MTFDPKQPYNSLPPLPPTVDVESRAVLKQAIAASRALAELKGHGGVIPNQAMLINSLVLQEAKASSEIENIVTTNDALFRAMAAGLGTVDPATKEVLRYREALWRGFAITASVWVFRLSTKRSISTIVMWQTRWCFAAI